MIETVAEAMERLAQMSEEERQAVQESDAYRLGVATATAVMGQDVAERVGEFGGQMLESCQVVLEQMAKLRDAGLAMYIAEGEAELIVAQAVWARTSLECDAAMRTMEHKVEQWSHEAAKRAGRQEDDPPDRFPGAFYSGGVNL